MNSSIRLFTWFRIPVRLHWTFGFIFLYVYYEWDKQGAPNEQLPWLMGLVLAMFFCVLLHEYGHALTARRYGISTRDIILTPIGGIARLERMPSKPWQEFVVAIAGPLVNVGIALVIYLVFKTALPEQWGAIQSGMEALNMEDPETGDIIARSALPPYIELLYNLFIVNIGLTVFNLLPIFPMDGGRVLRALLSMKLGRPKSTRIAARIGQTAALAGAVYALWEGHYQLLILCFFVFVAARTENQIVQMDDFLLRYRVSDLMRPQFTRFYANDWIRTAIELLQRSLERHFLVFDLDDRLAGLLEEDRIVEAMQKNQRSGEIRNYMSAVQTVHPDAPLNQAWQLIHHQGCGMVAVVDETGLIGVVDEAGLNDFIRINR